MDVKIILEPGKPPELVGSWTNGQMREVLMVALRWLDSLPLTQPVEKQSEAVNDGR